MEEERRLYITKDELKVTNRNPTELEKEHVLSRHVE